MPLSFEVLSYDEIGVKYHNVTKVLGNETFGEGRHYVAPGEGFFVFKSTFIIINFVTGGEGATHPDERTISCLTSDGLPVEIEATIQYQLREGDLPQLLRDFGYPHWSDAIIATAGAAVRLACGNSTAEQMYNNRQGVQTAILDQVQSALQPLYADVSFVELNDVTLPPEYSAAVGEKEASKADVDVAMNQRTQALITSQTQLLTAMEDAKISIIQAQAKADGIVAAAQADAAAIENDLNVKALIYKEVMDSFGFTPDELLNYISVEQLVSLDDLTVGLHSPAPFGIKSSDSGDNDDNDSTGTTGVAGTTGVTPGTTGTTGGTTGIAP